MLPATDGENASLIRRLRRMLPHVVYVALAALVVAYAIGAAREVRAIDLMRLSEMGVHAEALKNETGAYLNLLSEAENLPARHQARAKVISRLKTIQGLRNSATGVNAFSTYMDRSFAKTYADLVGLDPSQAHESRTLKAIYRDTLLAAGNIHMSAENAALNQTSLLRDYAALSSLLLVGALSMGWIVIALLLKLRARNRELHHLATNDSLTGLPLRRSASEKMKSIAAARRGLPLSVAVIDIDHFKRINDAHGHPVGDAVLVSVAQTVRDAARQNDFVARMGGEEFMLMLPETSEDEARLICERVRHAVASGNHSGFTVTISVGVVTTNGDRIDWNELYRLADQALYSAKQAGRNRVVQHLDAKPATIAA